jgi:hypothetical protein
VSHPFWKSRGFVAQVGVTLATLGGALMEEMPWRMAGALILISWGLFIKQAHARSQQEG